MTRGLILTGPYRGLPRRPRHDRSCGLVPIQIRQLVNSAAYAEVAGLYLNALLTIRFHSLEGFSPEVWARVQTRLFDRMSRWLLLRGIAPSYVWTRERVRGIGCHAHVIIHLGNSPVNIAPKLHKYLTTTGGFNSKDDVHISMGEFGAQTVAARAGLRRYIAKGFNHRLWRYNNPNDTENLGAILGLEHRGSQGNISIKRAGVSQNLGLKARRLAGWHEVKDLAGLRFLLNPTEIDPE